MRKLHLQRSAEKDLLGLPAKQYRQVVSAIFELLREPFPHYSKALRGSSYWRIAVGGYRVIYRVDDETVYVVAFGKRNDGEIYRALS
jgi:mRNA interferase RelE/StbE